MFGTIVGLVGAGFTALICMLAFLLGEKIERIGTTAYIVAWLLTTFVVSSLGDESQGNWLMLVLDLGLLATFATIVWKAPRNWPVWACAFQILIVASQVLILMNFDTPMVSYFIIVNMASVGILISIAFGSVMAWQERKAVRRASSELGGYS